jgi:hypothetical protein
MWVVSGPPLAIQSATFACSGQTGSDNLFSVNPLKLDCMQFKHSMWFICNIGFSFSIFDPFGDELSKYAVSVDNFVLR